MNANPVVHDDDDRHTFISSIAHIISFPVTWCFAGGRWLNLHDGACFLINIIRQTNMAAKKAMLHRGRLLKIYSLIKKFVVLGRIFTFIVF